MKTFRKALSIILGIAMMLSCVAGMQVSATEGNTIELTVGEATVKDGVVTVPVIATGSIQALTATVAYDDALVLTGAEKAAIVEEGIDSAVFGPTDAETFKMQWAFALTNENVVLDNTTIATLTFNVVDTAAETANINLEITEAWDVDGNAVAATANDATVDLVVKPAGPVVDDTLVVAGASVGYGVSSLQIGFRVRKTVIQKYDRMELVITSQKYDSTTLNLVDPQVTVVPLAVGGTFTTYTYSDIYLYEIGLDIEYLLRGYDAEGNLVAVSETFTTSPASYLKTTYASSTDSNLRTLIADTLIVGDEAAKAFGVEGSDLAAAPSVLEGFDTSEATATYGDLNVVDLHNAVDAAYGTASSCAHQARKSVSIGKAPYISYRIKGASSLDIDKLTFTVSYTQVTGSGGATAPYSKTFTSADGSVYKSGSFAMFKFDQVGLLDGDKDLSIVGYYDGVEVFNATYSIESYLGANTESAIGGLAVALIKLGDSARAYFA